MKTFHERAFHKKKEKAHLKAKINPPCKGVDEQFVFSNFSMQILPIEKQSHFQIQMENFIYQYSLLIGGCS